MLGAFQRRTVPLSKVGRRCVAQTANNAHNLPCTRTITAGSFSFLAGVGTYSVRFQGRTSKKHELKPGHYALIITATNTAGHGAGKLTFTIVS